ncbi:MAG: hypothetical protein PHO41_11925 [Eubacteriales bacterium]|nr:hypothetical protein [Eubacteriales bacterium]
MRIQDFKDGKISVWAETKADAERFLKACEAAGLTVSVCRCAGTSYVCGWKGFAKNDIGWCDDRYYAQNNAHNGKPFTSITVAEFCAAPKRNEQIIAYYNPDDTVTCLHKRDGKVVGSATVKKYYTDADDLRVAAKCALGKMLGEQKRENGTREFYQPGDRALVRGDLVQFKAYGGLSWLPGMNEEISGVVTLGYNTTCGKFQVRGWYISPEMLVGKIVPLDGLKAGDEVLVKSKEELDPFYHAFANKVLKVEKIDCMGDAFVVGCYFTPTKRFVGKLLRAPSKG